MLKNLDINLNFILKEYSYKLIDFLPKIFSAILVFILFLFIYKILHRAMIKNYENWKIDESLKLLFLSVLKYIIIGLGIITACGQLNIHLTSIIAGIGVLSLAFSLAAKDTIQNFISGIIIIIDKTFNIGDTVIINGTKGIVSGITSRSIRIETQEKYIKIIPNSIVVNSEITNLSINKERKIFMDIPVSYKTNISKIRNLIISYLKEDKRIELEPKPLVFIENFLDSSINLKIIFKINNSEDETSIKIEFLEKFKNILQEENIEIPLIKNSDIKHKI